MSYEVKHEEKWFWVSNMEISKTSQKLNFRVTKKDPSLISRTPLANLHFRVTKKDRGLSFHLHVLNLFKSWSNLGFDQDSNGPKNSKKSKKKEKPKHIAF
jgi:hypothetical protein